MNFSTSIYLGHLLGSGDIITRYRRSFFGPLWITVSTGILTLTISVVFGAIFGQPLKNFLPHLTLGIIFWNFFNSTIVESCSAFIESEGIIKQLKIPFMVFIIRGVYRNLLILFHNLLIFPFLCFFLDIKFEETILMSALGLIVVLFFLSWICLLLALLCTRYRDLVQVVINLLQISFYLTPIIWMESTVNSQTILKYLLFNPFYHMLEVIRAPLLGQFPDVISFYFLIVFGAFGWLFAAIMLIKFKFRIVYWL